MNQDGLRGRWVAHIDMDAFYASVEQLTRPALRGRPVLVGGTSGKGVVAGASYEARTFGARSAMPMHQAIRMCHHRAVVVNPRREVYQAASRKIFRIISRFAGVVEQISIDEGFAEPSELVGREGAEGVEAARSWASELQKAVEDETGLPCSIGMAATKLDAKMASDLAKPHGIFVVDPDRRADVFHERSVAEVWGIGRVAQGRLHEVGVETIGQFVRMDRTDVRTLLGNTGLELQRMAAGQDLRPVAPRARAKQVSAEQTLAADVRTTREVLPHLDRSVRHAHARLLKDGRAAKTITVKIRTADFQIHTRSATLAAPTEDVDVILSVARRILPRPEDLGAVRLVGLGLSGLADDRQQLLFPELDTDKASGLAGADVVRISSDIGRTGGVSGTGGELATPVDEASAEKIAARRWRPTQDVHHEEFGHGWVQGVGEHVLTVRFETRATDQPGRVKNFPVTTDELRVCDPLESLDWELSRVEGDGGGED
ncbi:DNA polymerase IV [Corynebacterium sp. HMSC28B08]|uniref:DNA polymerase IV n=1 Tax=Corynebacterium sp. HMSC28B08 TaxID=1581066 RepID=UPI0008A3DCDF|nr:DNA polymerase IV [Corynebacterium sp. HMSC28B08]OFT88420.1 DNA polymerase IV [Corynebacterium sp. HMSC28B08]